MFPPEIISHAVWLYLRFCLSFRDAEDLLAQRGIVVTYETIRHGAGRSVPPMLGYSGVGAVGWATPGIWTSCSLTSRGGSSISGERWTRTAT